jgi:hypothetical protein
MPALGIGAELVTLKILSTASNVYALFMICPLVGVETVKLLKRRLSLS